MRTYPELLEYRRQIEALPIYLTLAQLATLGPEASKLATHLRTLFLQHPEIVHVEKQTRIGTFIIRRDEAKVNR